MSDNRIVKATLCGLAALVFVSAASAAEPHVQPMEQFARSTVSGWLGNPTLVAALKAQNEKHTGLSQAQIDQLDKQWRAETELSERPLITETLKNELSKFLREAKSSAEGLVTEVFVMDNRGLNVGQSDVTSDFWQGDEAKWQKTFLAGPDALFIDGIEQDESTQEFQSQLSMSIVDPASGAVIGAITVGVNVDVLLQ